MIQVAGGAQQFKLSAFSYYLSLKVDSPIRAYTLFLTHSHSLRLRLASILRSPARLKYPISGNWQVKFSANVRQRENQNTLAPQGLSFVWDVDSLDWKDLSASEITRRVTSKVQPGSIVLFHNAAKHTPEALPGIIEYLLQEGYTFVPISELIMPGTCGEDYAIDHTGRQCPKT